MKLLPVGFVLLFTYALQAQEPDSFDLPQADTTLKTWPVVFPAPLPEYWNQDTIIIIPDTIMVIQNKVVLRQQGASLPDTIEQVPSSALTDSMLWSYLYLDELDEKSSLTIIGTGDIMLGTSYPSEQYLPAGQDCRSILSPVHEVLRSGDLLFGNMEGVFCSEGGTPKKCRDLANCYVFRMPDHFLSCFVDAGYDVLSVANNHVNDFGPVGRASTAAMLDSVGIAYAGFITHPWTLFEKDGISYGFAAFAPNQGTMDIKDYQGAAAITAMLDSIADVVIISFHGGGEGREHQHVIRGDEYYLGENRGNVYQFAHMMVDAGADIVFGHGPHVTRAVELYADRMICYSLGNFATYGRFNLSGPNGIAPIVRVRVDRQGRFLDGEVVSTYQPGEGGPRIDPAGRAAKRLKELSELDFPDQELAVDIDGSLWKR